MDGSFRYGASLCIPDDEAPPDRLSTRYQRRRTSDSDEGAVCAVAGGTAGEIQDWEVMTHRQTGLKSTVGGYAVV